MHLCDVAHPYWADVKSLVLVKIWKTFDVDCLLNSSSMPDAFFFYDSAALPVNSSMVFLQAVLCNC